MMFGSWFSYGVPDHKQQQKNAHQPIPKHPPCAAPMVSSSRIRTFIPEIRSTMACRVRGEDASHAAPKDRSLMIDISVGLISCEYWANICGKWILNGYDMPSYHGIYFLGYNGDTTRDSQQYWQYDTICIVNGFLTVELMNLHRCATPGWYCALNMTPIIWDFQRYSHVSDDVGRPVSPYSIYFKMKY